MVAVDAKHGNEFTEVADLMKEARSTESAINSIEGATAP